VKPITFISSRRILFQVFLFVFFSTLVNSKANPKLISDGPKEAEGFRVQIFAAQIKAEAVRIKSMAEEKFKDMNINIYVEEYYDSPYPYKVRIGDCKTLQEAMELRTFAKRSGYNDAWIVRSKIVAY